MPKSSKDLQALSLRNVAKSEVLHAVSERVIVEIKRRLIRSTDILAKCRADRLSSHTPANGKDNPRPNQLSSNEYDRRCSIFVSCSKCARIHDTGIFFVVQYGPVRKQSLADLCNENLPKYLIDFPHTLVTCPWTGKQFRQPDNHKIFLVPTNNSGRQAEKG